VPSLSRRCRCGCSPPWSLRILGVLGSCLLSGKESVLSPRWRLLFGRDRRSGRRRLDSDNPHLLPGSALGSNSMIIVLILRLHSDVSPPIVNDNLHLISQANLSRLLRRRFFMFPQLQPDRDSVSLNPWYGGPPTEPVLPQSGEDIERREPLTTRMDCNIRSEIVSHPDIRIQIDAFRTGQRIVGVDETAFRAFDVECGQAVGNATETERWV
jgi:hypothetical protein